MSIKISVVTMANLKEITIPNQYVIEGNIPIPIKKERIIFSSKSILKLFRNV